MCGGVKTYIVFPDIHVSARLLIDPVSLETRVRLVLSVYAPANTTGLEKIDDGLNALVNLHEVIEDNAVPISAQCRDVVWLGRVRYAPVVVKLDAQSGEIGEVRVTLSDCVVLILEEDLHIAVKVLAFEMTGRVQGKGSCCGGGDIRCCCGSVHVRGRRRRL